MGFTKKTLGTCLAGSLAAANIVASKITSFAFPVVGDVTAPAGFLGIALAFLFSDIIGEVYGEKEARETVNAAVASMAAVYGIVYSAVLMPAAPFYQYSEAFDAIMGAGGTIVLASIATMLVSQNIDVSLFHRLKRKTDIKAVRNLGSTAVSQAVDTALFIGLGFVALPAVFGGEVTPLHVATSLVVSQYAAKLVVALLDTPVFYAASSVLEE